jgi:hypothetical protein
VGVFQVPVALHVSEELLATHWLVLGVHATQVPL